MKFHLAAILAGVFALASYGRAASAAESTNGDVSVQLVKFAENLLTEGNGASDWSLQSLTNTIAKNMAMQCSTNIEAAICTRDAPVALRARVYFARRESVDSPLVVSFSLDTPRSIDAVRNAMHVGLWKSEPSSHCALRFRSANSSGLRQAIMSIQRTWDGDVCNDVAQDIVISFVDKTKVYPVVR